MAAQSRWLSSALGACAIAAFIAAPSARADTATPIKHLVVIFQENVSFDHYFGTYPNAKNPAGEPPFFANPDTPSVNGLSGGLLNNNPNLSNPFRLDRSQAATCDQNHDYMPEQQAFDSGLMDKFVQFTGVGTSTSSPCPDYNMGPNLVMGYFDGNTVTALWNYAQRYAMNDNSFGTNFGPSTVGAVNLVSGQTHGATSNVSGDTIDGTIIGDPDPTGDKCSGSTTVTLGSSGKNIGDLLNAKGITWGFFEGGFDLTITNPDGSTGCNRTHTSFVTRMKKSDYIPHHEPFQYYTSTANPNHTRPSSVAAIGTTDAANHQYDIHDFFDALARGNFPAVSILKAPGYQDGHPGYSDPLDEQTFIVNVLNTLQESPEWKSTAVIINWDDSDGWYDHQIGPIESQSNTTEDALTGADSCGTAMVGAFEGRCGYGPRLPLLVISPFAKTNFVDHSVTDQSSIIRFIEDNWNLGPIGNHSSDANAGSLLNMFDFSGSQGNNRLCLDPSSGEPTKCP
jgi:phospholipase C